MTLLKAGRPSQRAAAPKVQAPAAQVRLNVNVDADLYRELRLLAVKDGVTVSELVRGWIATKVQRAAR